jgi:threonine dehydrogenase-like Zn-dependent dehydrogenase
VGRGSYAARVSGGVTAAVKVGPGSTELRELPVPDVASDAGLLRIEAAGICGSDARSYPRPSRHGQPHVMGHENTGCVVAIGPDASRRWGVREGDRVVLEEYLPCGRCEVCRTGEVRFCEQTNIHRGGIAVRYGSTPLSVPPGLWGGYSEMLYMHPSSIVHPLGPDVPAEIAAMTLPLANGWQWAHLEGGAAPGRTVLVIGPGQQGLGCVIGAREAGADLVIVAGTSGDRERLAVASSLGADHAVDVDAEDLVERVRAITDGKGVDLAIDTAAASDATIGAALDAIRDKGGTVLVAAGAMDRTLERFPVGLVKRKYATVKGVRGHSHEAVRKALEIVASGRYPLASMSTHRFGLDRVDEALRTAAAGGAAIHVSVVPGP